jgi:hypothetical protein
MRIKGPTNGAPPVEGVEAPDEVGEIADVGATDAAAPVSGTAPASGTGAIDPVGQVAAQLRAGKITVDQAVEQLIDDAIGRQLSPHHKEAKELERKLRELLRSYAESDPFLAARIRRLTVAK